MARQKNYRIDREDDNEKLKASKSKCIHCMSPSGNLVETTFSEWKQAALLDPHYTFFQGVIFQHKFLNRV